MCAWVDSPSSSHVELRLKKVSSSSTCGCLLPNQLEACMHERFPWPGLEEVHINFAPVPLARLGHMTTSICKAGWEMYSRCVLRRNRRTQILSQQFLLCVYMYTCFTFSKNGEMLAVLLRLSQRNRINRRSLSLSFLLLARLPWESKSLLVENH